MKVGFVATYDGEGRKESLVRMIESLDGQLDYLFINSNSMIFNDELIKTNRLTSVQLYYTDQDLTDNAKFCFSPHFYYHKNPSYIFTLDDDLIYPPTYVADTIKKIDKHKCPVSYHGRILTAKRLNYYNSHTQIRCLGELNEDVRIDVAGTGVTAWATKDYMPSYDLSQDPRQRMSDLIFSLDVAMQNKKIMGLAHSYGYFKYGLDVNNPDTIYNHFHGKDISVQNGIADTVYNLRHNEN